MSRPTSLPFLTLFAVASLAATALGLWICLGSGAPFALTGRNLAAWALGAALAVGSARLPVRAMAAPLLLTPLLLAAVFAHPGMEGVHRWVALGPLIANAALLAAPAVVVAIAVSEPRAAWPWVMAFLSLTLLVAQPDASQATALAASLAIVAARRPWPPGRRVVIAVAALALAVAGWTRDDPLAPVPEVEEVLGLGWRLSPPLAACAFLALIAAAVLPALAGRRAGEPARTAGFALCAYMTLTALAPFAGAFPTPLVGVGVSPVLGWWLAAGLLGRALRAAGRGFVATDRK